MNLIDLKCEHLNLPECLSALQHGLLWWSRFWQRFHWRKCIVSVLHQPVPLRGCLLLLRRVPYWSKNLLSFIDSRQQSKTIGFLMLTNYFKSTFAVSLTFEIWLKVLFWWVLQLKMAALSNCFLPKQTKTLNCVKLLWVKACILVE